MWSSLHDPNPCSVSFREGKRKESMGEVRGVQIYIYICDSGGIRLGQGGVMALACGQWSQMAWVQIPATILLAV